MNCSGSLNGSMSSAVKRAVEEIVELTHRALRRRSRGIADQGLLHAVVPSRPQGGDGRRHDDSAFGRRGPADRLRWAGVFSTVAALMGVAKRDGARTFVVTAQPEGSVQRRPMLCCPFPPRPWRTTVARRVGAADGLVIRGSAVRSVRGHDPEAARPARGCARGNARQPHQSGMRSLTTAQQSPSGQISRPRRAAGRAIIPATAAGRRFSSSRLRCSRCSLSASIRRFSRW